MLRMPCALRDVVAILASAGALGACAAIAGVELPPGKAVGTAGDIEFGEAFAFPADPPVLCGQPTRRKFIIKNGRAQDVPYKLSLARHGTFSLVAGAEGTLKAKAEQEIEVEAHGVLPGPQLAELVLTYDKATRVIPLKADVRGAWIVTTPSVANLGEALAPRAGLPLKIELRNEGNEGVTLGDFHDLRPQFDTTSTTVSLAPGQNVSVEINLTGGGASTDAIATDLPLKMKAGTLCGAPPTLKLTGSRLSGTTIVSPLTVDFGDIPCGSVPAEDKIITVQNASTNDVGYETALGADSLFTVLQPNGTVPASKSVEVHVVLKGPVPLQEISEELTITVGGAPRKVMLHAYGYGAKLTVEPNPPQQTVALGQSQLFTIRNTGNAPTCVKYTKAQDAFVAGDVGYLNPQDENTFGVSFTGAGGGLTTSIAIDNVACEVFQRLNAPICEPRPAAIAVTGQR